MAKYVTEVLKELNDDPSLFETTYRKQGNGGPLGQLFYHAFVPAGKFVLPAGSPPYKPDSAPIGMSPVRLISEIRKFPLFCRTDLSANKRESLFIQLLESVHPSEAAVILAVKEQTLPTLYPKLTASVVARAGFIPAGVAVDTPVVAPEMDAKMKASLRRAARRQKANAAKKAAAEVAAQLHVG